MISINKATIQGRVGSDPEIKEFENSKLASFSVAINEGYKNKSGDWVDKTTWHKVKCFGPTTDFVKKHIVKGMIVYVEGSIDLTPGEKDGVKFSYCTIKAHTIIPDWQSAEPKEKPEIKHNPEPQVNLEPEFEVDNDTEQNLPF